jgi:hypothetical protein
MQEVRGMSALQCSRPGCVRIVSEHDAELCDYHLMGARRQAGLCANCGSERKREPVINALTGRQLKRAGELAWELVCQGCGRKQREWPEATRWQGVR